MRHALGALAALAIVAASVASADPVQAGPEPDGANPAPALTLLRQAAWTPIGGRLELVLDAQNVPADVQIRYSVHTALTSRTAFDETLTGAGLGPNTVLVPNQTGYAALPAVPGGGRALYLSFQSPFDPTGLAIDDPGIYPLSIDLIDAGGARLDGFVTYVVLLEPNTAQQPTVEEQLRVAWVWPLQTAPLLRANRKPDPIAVDDLLASGRIGLQLRALVDHPAVDVTIAPGPETTDAWGELAGEERRLESGFDNLRAVARRHEVLTGPYVGLDYPAIVAGGLGTRVGPELIEGSGALDRRLDARLDSRVAIVRPASQTALEQLRSLGIDRVFLDARALAPEPFELTPARPFALQVAAEQAIEGAAGDSGLEALLVGDRPPALRAQQLLAGLAIVALEDPDVARGVTLVNPSDWDPPLRFLDATLDGLAGHPLLQPINASEYFELGLEPAPDGAGFVVRELAPAPPPDDPPVDADVFFGAHSAQDAFREFLGVGDPKLQPGDRALLVSLSSAYQTPLGRLEATSQLDVVNQQIDEELALIRVPEAGGTVTLTAREGDLPVTFLNDTGREVAVRVQLHSQQLQFPDGAAREIVLPPRSHTVRFPVEARAPGNYPLTLDVTTVDGGLQVQSTRVNVRSTFVSGVGKFLTIGAAVFLAMWWALDIRRRRKRARAAATPA